jgi:hypothetical protein
MMCSRPHLCQSRNVTIFIFTPTYRDRYLAKLSADQFSADELRDYFNEFNETNEPGIGQAMLDGIRFIGQSLSNLDADSVIVFSIG